MGARAWKVSMVGLVGVVLASASGCGDEPAAVSTRPLPTVVDSTAPVACGGLPTKAAELAIGRVDLRYSHTGPRLDDVGSAVAAGCLVYPTGERKWALDVSYKTAAASTNQQMMQQYEDGPKKGVSLVPADLGSGLLVDPWESGAPSAQVTLMEGEKQVQITLARGPKERDQSKDVVALARLLKPVVLG